MAINKKYSYKSFKGQTFTHVDPKEFSDSEIVGSSFYQQLSPYTKVFPDGTKNLVLTRCNLDNVEVQPEIIQKGGCNSQILTQKDGEYWLVGKDLKPILPRDEAAFDKCGLSKLPADIPLVQVEEPVTIASDPDVIMQKKIEALKADDAELKSIIVAKEAVPTEVVKVAK